MAFKREHIENSYSEIGQTTSPMDNEKKSEDINESKTLDSSQVEQSYSNDPHTKANDVDTGAFIPKDMTVKLVRADAANWEIFLTSLYSFTLTLFGIFLGAWISDINEGINSFSMLEKSATFFFLLLSIILIVIWIIIKINQKNKGVKISYDLFKTLEK